VSGQGLRWQKLRAYVDLGRRVTLGLCTVCATMSRVATPTSPQPRLVGVEARYRHGIFTSGRAHTSAGFCALPHTRLVRFPRPQASSQKSSERARVQNATTAVGHCGSRAMHSSVTTTTTLTTRVGA
jgi:hypothetical protein